MNHVLATRYKADIGLGKLSVEEAIRDVKSKQAANEEANRIMKGAFEEKKSRWLFTTLKF